MATNVLAIGSTPATSSEFTLSEPAALFLTSAANGPRLPEGAMVHVQAKSAGGTFHYFAALSSQEPSGVAPAGTYRCVRVTGAVGVERA